LIRVNKNILTLKRFGLRMLQVLLILPLILLFVYLTQAQRDNISDTYQLFSDQIDQNEEYPDDIEFYNLSYYFEYVDVGNASWYGKRFHNRKTASGQIFDMHSFTAAHRDLPLGSIARVTNNNTGEKALIKINDRGPFIRNKMIDLSHATANAINALGNPEVTIETLIINGNYEILSDDNCYFGFSLDLPLVCISGNVIDFIVSYDDFQNAVDEYMAILKDNSQEFIYLFTKVHNTKSGYNLSEEKYFIGIFTPEFNTNPSGFAGN